MGPVRYVMSRGTDRAIRVHDIAVIDLQHKLPACSIDRVAGKGMWVFVHKETGRSKPPRTRGQGVHPVQIRQGSPPIILLKLNHHSLGQEGKVALFIGTDRDGLSATTLVDDVTLSGDPLAVQRCQGLFRPDRCWLGRSARENVPLS